MPLIYITGPTGSGKSTICKSLRDLGYKTYDTDDEGLRKIQNVDGKEMLSLDIDTVQSIHDTAGDDIIFICGTSATDLSAQNLFSRIILLNIDEAVQEQRILQRTNNQYGKKPHQLANALKWRQVQIEKYQKAGAITIDATQPIKDIIAQIINISKLN